MTNSSETAIEISGLHKTYRGAEAPAVAGVDLTVAAGSFFGLLGPNGAGKTTLISMMCALLSPDKGSVRMAGIDLASDPEEVKRRIGVVPQDIAVYPALTSRENLEFFGRMMGLSGAPLEERVEECLNISRLGQYAERRVQTLSGGLKRRLSLVIGMVHQPEILLLDEPTVGIDPQSRLFIYDSLKRMNASGMTIVYTSHYMEEVEMLCRDIAVIDQGRIIARGGLDALLAGNGRAALEIRTETALSEDMLAKIKSLPKLRAFSYEDMRLKAESDEPTATLQEIISTLRSGGVRILSVSQGASNLEDLFLALTGRGLRE